MIRNKIENFCEDILEDYCLYLYNKEFGKRINGQPIYSNFPYCCKLSADIITSYLNLYFGPIFKYICTTNRKIYNHAWTLYEGKNERFIIDFTDFQHKMSSEIEIKFKEHMISKEELIREIKKNKVVVNEEQSYCYAVYDIMIPKEQISIGSSFTDYKAEFNKNDFMKFLKLVSEEVYDKTSYL